MDSLRRLYFMVEWPLCYMQVAFNMLVDIEECTNGDGKDVVHKDLQEEEANVDPHVKYSEIGSDKSNPRNG